MYLKGLYQMYMDEKLSKIYCGSFALFLFFLLYCFRTPGKQILLQLIFRTNLIHWDMFVTGQLFRLRPMAFLMKKYGEKYHGQIILLTSRVHQNQFRR